MKFSCLIATLNRPQQLLECICSILGQTYHDLEIIIVDQSDNCESEHLVMQLIKKCEASIIYHHVNDFKGLSKARNYGLKFCSGDFIALMDDDAIYEAHYLENAAEYSHLTYRTVLSGIIIKSGTQEPYVNYSIATDGQSLTYFLIAQICPSAGLVIPNSLLKEVRGFDERLGAGTEFGAGEETDVLIQVKQLGSQIIHLKSLILYHPLDATKDKNYYKKVYLYYKGFGALIKKHLIRHHNLYLVPKALRIGVGAFIKYLAGNIEEKREYAQRIRGFYCGLVKF